MRRMGIVLTIVLMTASARAAGRPGPAVRLVLQFPPGRTLHYRSTTQGTVRQLARGRVNTIRMRIVMDLSETVLQLDRTEGLATMKYSFDAVRVRIESPAGVREYDSSRPEAAEPRAVELLAYRALVGQSFTARVSTDGQVKAVEHTARLLRAALGRVPESQRLAVQPILEQLVSVASIKQQLGARSDYLPAGEDPVRVGNSWTPPAAELSVGFVRLGRTAQVTLEQVDRRAAVLGMAIRLGQGKPRPVALPNGGGTIQDQLKGARPGWGRVVFDRAGGYPAQIHTVLQFRVATTLQGARGDRSTVDQQVDLTHDLTLEPAGGAETRIGRRLSW